MIEYVVKKRVRVKEYIMDCIVVTCCSSSGPGLPGTLCLCGGRQPE